jgi:hypothetical protein
MIRKRNIAPLLALSFICIQITATADLQTAKKSVVVVKRYLGAVKGTGFVWPKEGYIVTAYHVVAGIDEGQIAVQYEGKPEVPARIDRVLRDRDLALLKVDEAEQRPAAEIRGPSVEGGMKIVTYAIGQGINEITSWEGTVRDTPAKTTLERFLTSEARQPAKSAGFPDLTAEIIACELAVRPGSSGAPAFDKDARVCGIVSGGLEGGLGSVSWLIPANALEGLLAAPAFGNSAQLVSDRKNSSIAFSADALSSGEKEEEISGLRVVKLRTRTLSQIIGSNFDSLGLGRVTSALASVNGAGGSPDWSKEQFDIYSIESAGSRRGKDAATIVLPKGVDIVADAGTGDLFAKDPMMEIEWKLQRQVVTGNSFGWWGQREATKFEEVLGAVSGLMTWQPDPHFSDFSAIMLPSGYGIQRRGLVGYVPFNNGFAVVPKVQGNAAITHNGLRNESNSGTLLSIGMICKDAAGAMDQDRAFAQKRISIWTVAVFASGVGNTDLSPLEENRLKVSRRPK